MKKKTFVRFALVLAAVAAPSLAAAQPRDHDPDRDRDRDRGRERDHRDDHPDDELDDSGFSFGARTGYMLPMGSIAKDASLQGATDLSKTAAGTFPIGLEAGYRITPNIYVGAWFQLGFVATSGDLCNRYTGGGAGCSSSGTDIRTGINARYTFSPQAKFAPWVGLGFGYEVLNIGVTVGPQSGDISYKGFELLDLQVGGDYHVSSHVSIGPMLGFSLAQYGSYSGSRPGQSFSGDLNNTSLHQWFTFGLQGHYDL